MDPLSDVLRSFRLTGGVFLDARFTAPWCVATRLSAEDCKKYMTDPLLLIAYHFVVEGRLLISVEGEPAIEVRAGEVVLLPRNDLHVLGSGYGLDPVSALDLIRPSDSGGLARVSHGGGGEATHIVCGFLGSQDPFNPVIAALPSILKLDVREGASGEWIDASVRFAANELTRGKLGSSSVMSRLSELLFVETVRHYATTSDNPDAGWLKGLADPRVGRALALMHGDMCASWSTEALAREVSMSRSAFVQRFTSLIGMPPIRYLTLWRLQAAKSQLRESQKTIGQLAYSVGYESEEAFSRAFKREFGLPPARWRDQQVAQ
ncbi:AraC family transcriptional regulator [Mesorhizobium sp. 113-1-2]|uniref:AraC family transcriptional regulator n=1 Tax=Mesorhizobium sp. 113-1-2 TaxID=2744515 RepID=UPI0019258A40|nr:AraC family transcriptional regulator [Mesorhizobium sp. 113-1-2]BCG75415.1 AraC family transcriptional regulator [Mesorhizobium sp. 113-1-2]